MSRARPLPARGAPAAALLATVLAAAVLPPRPCAVLAAPLAAEMPAAPLEELRELERAVIAAIEKAAPAFVFIEGGSGFLVSAEGHVLTNEHVVAGKRELEVRLSGGLRFRADVLGHDPGGDLALLKLRDNPAVEPLELGDSDALRVGEPVIALGDPFLLGSAGMFLGASPVSFEPSASLGVVSAVHRFSDSYFDAVQVDVAVNRGNSGGPLLTLGGKVVGINGKIETRFETGINTGVGYAVSANQIRRFLEPLKAAEGGTVHHGSILGLEVAERAEEGRGIEVTGVARGSLAERLGFQKGDRLTQLGGWPVPTRSRFRGILGTFPAGEEVPVKLLRGGQPVELTAPIVESGPAFLGVDTVAAEGNESGARIVKIHPGAAAFRGGLKPEDVIRGFNGEKVASVLDLARFLQGRAAGDLVKLTVTRSGSDLEVDVRLRGRGEGPR